MPTPLLLRRLLTVVACAVGLASVSATAERMRFNEDWAFALGHATDPSQDFQHATGYFSYLAKTGFGDGPASSAFDDRTWRRVQLPHDWAIEVPFDPRGSHSHGYKSVGPGFPESSVGWYRKHFFIPESDLGKKIYVEFDGIYRDADVFINGFFVGNEPSGYLGQQHDLTDYLNYGADNVVVVRVDASMEEGWFYEGAGIYRHAWLSKHHPLHFVKDGVWVNPQFVDGTWTVHLQAEIKNHLRESSQFQVRYRILDAKGKVVHDQDSVHHTIEAGELRVDQTDLVMQALPSLWSLESPALYQLVAEVVAPDGVTDTFTTAFGFRTIDWDPARGFFLNGKSIKIVGSNNHQDHAGVGAAIPDSLQEWRLRQLMKMGHNSYRSAHNPPTTELLQACDRLGMLVINETRLMGINPYHFTQLERLVRRDRNHPSVILWGLGNEEWAIEGNIKGARITRTLQDYCHRLDPTRYATVAISGGWGGISQVVQVAGVNYIGQANPDQQHKDFPWQIILGTEETTTQQTRGIYVRDDARCHLPPLEDGSSRGNCEIGWKYYAERDWGAGVIFWTGFDYRGEPTPFGYPAISSQFGILDTCGFPKDSFYYLKSWWTEEPVLHLFPHWNWPGREGEPIEVRLHSNCASAELFLNGTSLGTQEMPIHSHLAWQVPYEAGELKVVGTWADGTVRTQKVQTTGPAARIELVADRMQLAPDRNEVAMVTVRVLDAAGRMVPTAENLIHFDYEGEGSILGVGNGNPSSLEADVFVESVWGETIGEWSPPNPADADTPIEWETRFDAPEAEPDTTVTLLFNTLGSNQRIVLNGQVLEVKDQQLPLQPGSLKRTGNTLRIEAAPFPVWRDREGLFQLHPASFRFEQAAAPWQRQVFNGLAQVILGATPTSGTLTLRASGDGLTGDSLIVEIR